MCVTVAIKLPRDRDTGEPTKDAKWTLFKIRDRAYDPHYHFKTYNDGKNTSLFLVDEDSDWSECIRVDNIKTETELMFVNSALNNSMDKKDGTDKSKAAETATGKRKVADHGLIARRVSRTADLDDAVKTFSEMKFDGCTFISDGDRCFLVESSLPPDAKSEIKKRAKADGSYGAGSLRSQATSEDFVTTTEEIKDWLAVRTNHGITNKVAGYQIKDGISFKSSENRRNFADAYIRDNVFEVSDILPAIDAMGDKTVNKNPFLRPRRIRREIEDWNANKNRSEENKVPLIYSTSAFVMTAGGNVHIKLYDAGISKVNIQKLYSKDFPIKASINR